MVLAPESDYVSQLTTPGQEKAVHEYLDYVAKRTERERQSEVKTVTGVFTGSYAINPFTNEAIPVWISEYVLAGYGTGAIMAVPAHDSRDYAFARKFQLPIIPVIDNGQPIDLSESSYDAKEGKMINSGIINGMEVKKAIQTIAEEVENEELAKVKSITVYGMLFLAANDTGVNRFRYITKRYALHDGRVVSASGIA